MVGGQDPAGAELQTVLSPVCPRLHELPSLEVSVVRWHVQRCGTADEHRVLSGGAGSGWLPWFVLRGSAWMELLLLVGKAWLDS